MVSLSTVFTQLPRLRPNTWPLADLPFWWWGQSEFTAGDAVLDGWLLSWPLYVPHQVMSRTNPMSLEKGLHSGPRVGKNFWQRREQRHRHGRTAGTDIRQQCRHSWPPIKHVTMFDPSSDFQYVQFCSCCTAKNWTMMLCHAFTTCFRILTRFDLL